MPSKLCPHLRQEELAEKSFSDEFANVVKVALVNNSDCEQDLYVHQYLDLYELAKGKGVMLIYPCGSVKTRVLKNAPLVAKLRFELRSGKEISKIPLGIVCCPLTDIMEDNISDGENCGML